MVVIATDGEPNIYNGTLSLDQTNDVFVYFHQYKDEEVIKGAFDLTVVDENGNNSLKCAFYEKNHEFSIAKSIMDFL